MIFIIIQSLSPQYLVTYILGKDCVLMLNLH
jgi:hypothetical protein